MALSGELALEEAMDLS